jgi:hypothetical protein
MADRRGHTRWIIPEPIVVAYTLRVRFTKCSVQPSVPPDPRFGRRENAVIRRDDGVTEKRSTAPESLPVPPVPRI